MYESIPTQIHHYALQDIITQIWPLLKMKITKNDLLFYLSLISAIWFAWMGMLWVYWAALFIAYPFGLLSFLLWRVIRNENRKRTKLIPVILVIGLALSLGVLIYLLIWE
ncbi:MAG: hypothetical protein ABIQ93_12195 [Saprospiraceae bacterium]